MLIVLFPGQEDIAVIVVLRNLIVVRSDADRLDCAPPISSRVAQQPRLMNSSSLLLDIQLFPYSSHPVMQY